MSVSCDQPFESGDDVKPVLLLGIGNILMRDDGVGVHVVNRIIESGNDIPGDVEVLDGGTAGYDLVPYMQGRKKIVIVDALKADDEPGAVYRFKPEHGIAGGRGYSLHQVGILEVIRTLRMTGHDPEIEIIGIVPEDISTMGLGLSGSLERALPRAVSIVVEAVS